MLYLRLLLFLSLSSSPFLCRSEVFTALTHMKVLVRLEQFLSLLLHEYVQQNQDNPKWLLQFADEVDRQTNMLPQDDVERFLGHPVNAFLLVRRFNKYWNELENYMDKEKAKDLLQIVSENKDHFPSTDDLMGSADAIFRLQDVYNISSTVIADGDLSHRTLSPVLGVDECFELGYINHDWEVYERAYDWMREAQRRLSPPYVQYSGNLRQIDVLEYLAWAEYETGRFDDAIKHSEEILQQEPENKNAKKNVLYFTLEKQKIKDGAAVPKEETPVERREYMLKYGDLCRGKTSKPQEQQNKLKCYYHDKHPSLVIRPAKVEVANLEPDIFLLHDILSEREIQLIKDTATPRLTRATVANLNTGKLEPANYRISKSCWIEDEEDDFFPILTHRIEAITGLSTKREHSEALQVVNYGVAGQYEPHYDHAIRNYSAILGMGMRNRIATVLFYLSDVESGGQTVFIDPEVIIKPVKGMAVFWHNLYKSGEGDARTRHAACPVIVGSKWVCNKWIHEAGQEFRRRCSLSANE